MSVEGPDELDATVRACADDRSVAGLILHGSRSIEGMARTDSDYDLLALVDGDAPAAPRPWDGAANLDVWEIPLSGWARHAMPGDRYAWNRCAMVHAKLLYQRPDTNVAAQLDRKRRLRDDEAAELADAALDEYVNDCYRSLKNHRDERRLEARLDAAASVSPLLTAVFAMHHRVRPYNRYLLWELDREPLADDELAAERLLPRLQRLLRDGDAGTQRQLVAQVEIVARRHGHNEIIDSWVDKLALLHPHT